MCKAHWADDDDDASAKDVFPRKMSEELSDKGSD
jgi:hypothetical protein